MDHEVINSTEAGHEICDFCGEPKPTWEFPCTSFEMVFVAEISDGVTDTSSRTSIAGWLTCDACKILVENNVGDGGALSVAVCQKNGWDDGPDYDAICRMFKRVYQQFYDNRVEDPAPFPPGIPSEFYDRYAYSLMESDVPVNKIKPDEGEEWATGKEKGGGLSE